MQSLVDFLDGIVQNVLHRVDNRSLFLQRLVCNKGSNAPRNVVLGTHERNKHVLVRQFFGEVLGVEAVAHVVVLHR